MPGLGLGLGLTRRAGGGWSPGRAFNGTTDKVTVVPAAGAIAANVIPGSVGSTVRRSHPVPFVLANGNLLLGYCSNEDFAAGSGSLYYKCATSADGGATFGAAVTVSNTAGTIEGAFCQLSGGNLVCVYAPGAAVAYRVSTDNGATWGAEQAVTASAGPTTVHPSCVLNGSTLTVVYISSTGTLVAKQATVTSSAVGAFGSEVVLSASTTCFDPNVVVAPDGELLVSYLDTAAVVKVVRSTDAGAGSAWGSPATAATGTTSANADPNMVADGTQVWLTYAVGTDQSGSYPSVVAGNRITKLVVSSDSGATWTLAQTLYPTTATDLHRVNWCIYAGTPLGFGAGADGDTDYHIDRLTPKTAAVAAVRLRSGFTFDSLATWTCWAWAKMTTGQFNAAGSHYLLSKGNAPAKGFLTVQYSGANTQKVTVFVQRATQLTQYATAASGSTFPLDAWFFVAASFDDAAGNGNRIKIYVGTTPANLAAVATPTITEGSGTFNTDLDGDLVLGSRSADTARAFKGDLAKLGISAGVLNLAQLQDVMRDTFPAVPPMISAWRLAGTDTTTAADRTVSGNDGTYTGTTAATSGPPSF